MSTFSSLLSSIGGPQKPPQPSSPGQASRKQSIPTNGVKLTPSNAAAGVKRKSEEPATKPLSKAVKTEQNDFSNRRAGSAPTSRFQLSAKPSTSHRPTGLPPNPTVRTTNQSTAPISTSDATPTPPSTANGPPPAKRGFASIMEKAKAAQEAAKAAGPSGIKHKPAERLTKRERLRLTEEAKAQQKAGKNGRMAQADRSRSGTPVTASKPGLQKKAQETNYQGTMKKRAEPLAYKGTMRAADAKAAKESQKKKGMAQDKYGGYASWSDLDDAEDEEEEGYDSEASSDMEGGFDDIEKEDRVAARAAWQEDKEALEEEERHRREKLERKRKLEELSRSAAARRRY